MGELAWGPGQVDWQEGINGERMRKERLARAQATLKNHGIAAALLLRPDNIRYTTSVKGVGFAAQLRFSLCFAEHDPIMYEHGSTLVHHKIHCPWIKPENWRCAYSWLMGTVGPVASREVARKWAADIVRDLKDKGGEKEKNRGGQVL